MEPQELVEHRYRAVLEVLDGAPVVEVGLRYGVSRQSVHTWRKRYRELGVEGLKERSRRPHRSPARLPADVEALICELRQQHPRWGARRVAFELGRRNVEDRYADSKDATAPRPVDEDDWRAHRPHRGTRVFAPALLGSGRSLLGWR
ncbi:helix-turn-helix domain-containing protein [Streptomyces sp. NBC_01006]|uniref:helix-turn-helix domain-containing protein n=1 Tax=Streptomyces sp. NBC_01006 TaxID=2903716 RepID=UPI0038693317|nr:helix-turn-helix domain-containing protein [Streptomyces sp. NBC_01006]